MIYELDKDTHAVLTAVIAGEDVQWQYFAEGCAAWVTPADNASPLTISGTGLKLRRKPRTIRIGEYDVPEPMRVEPADGVGYYLPNVLTPDLPHYRVCFGTENKLSWLAEGLCHATKEAANTHAMALISLTKAKP